MATPTGLFSMVRSFLSLTQEMIGPVGSRHIVATFLE